MSLTVAWFVLMGLLLVAAIGIESIAKRTRRNRRVGLPKPSDLCRRGFDEKLARGGR